jgi:peptidoglycan/xylan/chitin deacetylase (PgdA/CDA1 family)
VPDVLVLCYHAVSPRWDATLSVTPDRMRDQLRALARRGYEGTTFRRAVTDPPAKRSVAVTFDDSYRSVLERARPILDELGWPGTVFVPTAYAGAGEPRGWDGTDHWLRTEHADELTPMSWAELGELAAAGWELGSHTRTHPHLPRCTDAELADELQGSRADFERELGAACETLAYPYGEHDGRVVAAAIEAGYVAAAGLSAPERRPQRHAYPRVGVWFGTGPLRFRAKVSPTVRRLRATA